MTITMLDRIRIKLTEGLAPVRLDIRDDSARHQGHAGHRPGEQTHFEVVIVSAAFDGLSPVARHRLVYGLLSDELLGGVHALSLSARTPSEELRSGPP